MVFAAADDDCVQCAVELAVAAGVEPVALYEAGGGGDRGGAGEVGEGGLGGEAAVVRPGDKDLRGRGRTDAGLVEQRWRESRDQGLDLAVELAFLSRERLYAAGERAQRDQRAAQLRVGVVVRPHCCQTCEQPRSRDGYVSYTRHTTGTCDNGKTTFVYHATSRWPVSVAGGTSG